MSGDAKGDASVTTESRDTFAIPEQVTGHAPEQLKIDFGPSCFPGASITSGESPKRKTPLKRPQKLSTPAKRPLHAKAPVMFPPSVEEQTTDNLPFDDVMEGRS